MFRRLLIATVVGILAAFPLPGFVMRCCYWSGCSSIMTRQSGQCSDKPFPLATVANSALGGLAAGLLLMGWQKFTQQALMRRPITWKRCKPMDSSITSKPG